VYLPFFATDNFVTSKRLEAVLQHRTLEVMASLPAAMQARVHERFLDAPRSFGENGEEAGAIYCVFVTVTHVDRCLVTHGVHVTIVYSFEGACFHVSQISLQ